MDPVAKNTVKCKPTIYVYPPPKKKFAYQEKSEHLAYVIVQLAMSVHLLNKLFLHTHLPKQVVTAHIIHLPNKLSLLISFHLLHSAQVIPAHINYF